MKLLIIFNKDIEVSPEKVCIHVGHSNRAIIETLYVNNEDLIRINWVNNHYKNVLLRDKITLNLISKIDNYCNYVIYDAGLDGTFEPNTILGYAVLVPKNDETFKRLRTLKFN